MTEAELREQLEDALETAFGVEHEVDAVMLIIDPLLEDSARLDFLETQTGHTAPTRIPDNGVWFMCSHADWDTPDLEGGSLREVTDAARAAEQPEEKPDAP